MKARILILLLIFVSGYGYAQTLLGESKQKSPFKLWRLIYINGEAKVEGFYREQKIDRDLLSEFQKSKNYTGGLLINTRSAIWDPKFMLLDVDAEYNTGFDGDQYLVFPDRAEARTLNKLDLRSTFFSEKPVSLTTFASFNQLYQNRESLANIKSNNRNFGGMLSYANKYFPTQVGYSNSKNYQDELQTGRFFNQEQSDLYARSSFNLTKFDDRNEISYNHSEFVNSTEYINLKNKADVISLYNNYNLDFKRRYNFSSNISKSIQKGSYNLERLQVFENLSLKLPKNFNFVTSYGYNNLKQDSNKVIQHNVKSAFSHKLYESLYSGLIYEYNTQKSDFYYRSLHLAGFDIRYNKKIPTNGMLSMSYKYTKQFQTTESDPIMFQAIHEEYVLTDGNVVLLNRPYIDPASIIVRDVTGTVIYQLNFDYILIERNNYLEIQRIIGGLIPNATAVYIDYVASQPGSYKYVANNQSFYAGVRLFKQLMEFYYRFSKMDYVMQEKIENLVLNYYTQQTYGAMFEYKFAKAGTEYSIYHSNVIPYTMLWYYLDIQKNFSQRVNVSLHGSVRDYKMTGDSLTQKFTSFSGKVAYRIWGMTTISASAGYMNQRVNGIELNYLTSRLDLTTVYRQLYFSAGAELYRRNYLAEGINFYGGYLKIVRKF